jgi:tetratricopeptide (TPR) repeat protein
VNVTFPITRRNRALCLIACYILAYMHVSSRHPVAYSICAVIFIGSILGKAPASAQNPASQAQSPGKSKPTRHDSVEVVAKLSPEEIEEGKLNDAYESIAQQQRKGTCTTEIIERYRSEVIPLAEKSAFNVPKNKFLFLANRDIGNCYLAQQKFAEAETSFQKILQYVPVWPGTDDSAYPINFRQIATAQMSQQHWAEAEQSLLKSIAIFDPQIAAGEKSDAELHLQLSLNYRGSQSQSYALLAVVYFREGRTLDALTTVEKAYDEVTKYKLTPQFHNQVIKIGKAIAEASEDSAAQRTWSQRNPIQ